VVFLNLNFLPIHQARPELLGPGPEVLAHLRAVYAFQPYLDCSAGLHHGNGIAIADAVAGIGFAK
jgi:hypothetical protein